MRGIIVNGREGGGHLSLFVRCEDGKRRVLRVAAPEPSGRRSRISPVIRFMVENEIYQGIEFPDKEALEPGEFVPAELDIQPRVAAMEALFDGPSAVCVHLHDGSGEHPYLIQPSLHETGAILQGHEKELIESVNRQLGLADPDILLVWGAGQYERWLRRAKALGLRADYTFEAYDLRGHYEWKVRPLSIRLNDIAADEGFARRGEPRELSEVLQDYRTGDVGPAREYCSRRLEIVRRLEERYRFLDYSLGLKRVVGVHSLESLRSSIRTVTTLMMRAAKRRGISLQLGPEPNEEFGGIAGALTTTPPKGRFEDVAVFDMSRYYPSIILDFNLSPETAEVVRPDRKHPEVRFSFDKAGLFPEALESLISYRERLDERIKALKPDDPKLDLLKIEKQAIKGVMNSFYGVLANRGFAFYNESLAAKINELSREGLEEMTQEAERRGYRVLYSDTDSLFVKVAQADAPGLAERLTSHLRGYFRRRYGLPECRHLTLRLEKYLGAVIFLGVKKAYAEWVKWENGETDKVNLVGMAKSNRSRFNLAFMEGIYSLALRKAPLAKIREYTAKSLRDLRKASYEDLAIHVNLTREFGEYKASSPHLRAAKFANQVLGTDFREGSRVKVLWINGYPGYPKQNVIGFEYERQLPSNLNIDWKHTEEAAVRSTVEQVMEVLAESEGGMQRTLF